MILIFLMIIKIEKIILTPPSHKLQSPPPKICTSNGHPVFKPGIPLTCAQNFFSLPMANQIDCTKKYCERKCVAYKPVKQ